MKIKNQSDIWFLISNYILVFLLILVFSEKIIFADLYTAEEAEALKNHLCSNVCRVERGVTESLEVTRIYNCLNCLARDATGDEKILYRWGTKVQIEDMMTLSMTDFYAKLYPTQNKREQLINRKVLKGRGKNEYTRCFEDRNCSYQLHIQMRKYTDLEDLLVFKTGDIKTPEIVYKLLSYEKIYPGFIDNFHLSAEIEKGRLEDLASSAGSNYELMEREGELLGLLIFQTTKKSTKKRGFMTWGRGAYFALDPIHSIEHFCSNYSGISCNLNKKNVIDLDYTRAEGMLNLRLLYESKIIHGYGNSNLREFTRLGRKKGINEIYSPLGYNKFTNPIAFEIGAEGFILRFTSSSGTSLVAKKNSLNIRMLCQKKKEQNF